MSVPDEGYFRNVP